jgi:putative two-component system response regulator
VAQAAGTVVVADDEVAIADMLERLLVARGYVVLTAHNGSDALEIIRAASPDIVLSDVRMPRTDGFELCRAVKDEPSTRLTPVVLMTGAAEREDRMRAIAIGADDFLTKPVDEQELIARVGSLVRLKRHTDDLDSAEAVIESLALTIEARDPGTDGHCQRLARYGVALGLQLGLGDSDIQALRRGGFVHDIGKIAVPDAILLKTGKLTTEEIEIMRQHTIVGDRLCGKLRTLHPVRPIIRWHHERLDGSGYPDGLRGDAIPLLAQLVAIADVYDALTTARPYKKAIPPEAAYVALRDEVRRGWKRKDLVELLIDTARAGHLAD